MPSAQEPAYMIGGLRPSRKPRVAATALVLFALMAAPTAASGQACDISPPARETIAIGKTETGRVIGLSRAATPGTAVIERSRRTIVYQSEPLPDDEAELVVEKLSGSNEGRLTVCRYDADQNWDSARHLGNYAIDRDAGSGEAIEARFTGLQGQRLLVEVTTLRRHGPRSFGYRIRIDQPGAGVPAAAASDDIGQQQHVFQLDDEKTEGAGPGQISDAPAIADDLTSQTEQAEAQSDDELAANHQAGQIGAPNEVIAGSAFEVSWAESLHPRDLIAIVSAGADEEARGASRHQRSQVGDATAANLIAPAEAGSYEVRYLSQHDGLINSVPITVREAEIALNVPTRVAVGESFEVAWGDPIHHRDRLVVVAADADPSARGSSRHQRLTVRGSNSGTLIAPSEAGSYEVRYQLNQGWPVIARSHLEVVDATIDLTAPPEAVAGERVEVAWGSPIHSRDRVVLVPADSDEEARGASRHQRLTVRGNEAGRLTAPQEPGTYELRYQLNQDWRVVGRAQIEIVPEDAEISMKPAEPGTPEPEEPHLTADTGGQPTVTDPTGRISVPDQVLVGSTIWTDVHRIDHEHDFLLLVEPDNQDAHEDRYTRMSNRVGDHERIGRRAPIRPGLMEVRYYLMADRRIAARLPVQVVDTEIEITAPPRVEAGTRFDVSISDVLREADYLMVVALDRPDEEFFGTIARHRNRVGGNTEHTRRAPDESGPHELRYYINEGRDQRVIGRTIIEVVDGPVESGELADTPTVQSEETEAGDAAKPDPGPVDPEVTTDEVPAFQLAALEERLRELAAHLEGPSRPASPEARQAQAEALADVAHFGVGAVAVIEELTARDVISQRIARELLAAARTGQASAGHTVIGIEPNAVLYVRQSPGTDQTIIGMLAPDATGVAVSGQRYQASDGDWVQVVDPTLPGGSGWVEARFLEATTDTDAGASTEAQPIADTAPTQRVVNVAANDVLYIRQSPGTEATIVGMLAPDATGIVPSGQSETAADGGTWVEIVDPTLPAGSGWVNAHFLEAETAPGPGLAETATRMVATEGYEDVDPAMLEEALLSVLSADPQSAFVPGSDLTPLAKTVLLVEATEGEAHHARYRLSYGLAMVPAPPAADPVPLSIIQVDRFNLGPQVRAQLVGSLGEEHVAPAEAFGTGPHVSYRFAMRPIMGRTADLVAASRLELDGSQSECLGFHCLIAQGTGDHVTEWGEAAHMAPPDFETAYETVRDGALSPAAALDFAAVEMGVAGYIDGRLAWLGFEPREGVDPGEPFAEAIMEINLGQDSSVDVVIRDGNQMDHEIAVVWQRVTTVAGGDEPVVLSSSNTEPWPSMEGGTDAIGEEMIDFDFAYDALDPGFCVMPPLSLSDEQLFELAAADGDAQPIVGSIEGTVEGQVFGVGVYGEDGGSEAVAATMNNLVFTEDGTLMGLCVAIIPVAATEVATAGMELVGADVEPSGGEVYLAMPRLVERDAAGETRVVTDIRGGHGTVDFARGEDGLLIGSLALSQASADDAEVAFVLDFELDPALERFLRLEER